MLFIVVPKAKENDVTGILGWALIVTDLGDPETLASVIGRKYKKITDNGMHKLTVTIPKVEPPPPLKAQKTSGYEVADAVINSPDGRTSDTSNT